MGLNFDLQDQLVFYGQYHSNTTNKFIHGIFVPLIVWTALVWGYLSNLKLGNITNFDNININFDISLVAVILYAVYYIILDLFAGVTWFFYVGLPTWFLASIFGASVPNAALWALGIHIFSWYMQIHIGHIIYEKRKPALLDSLVQAFLLAPFFVWLELIFYFGYNPKLRRSVHSRIAARVAEYQKEAEGKKE